MTITRIRDLQAGDRFYLLRVMWRYTYIQRQIWGNGKARHIVLRDGVETTLHHSCHVKKIERAA